MRPINFNVPIQGQRFFDLFESSRKKENSPLKQAGYFHHGDAVPSGGLQTSIDEGRLGYAIKGLLWGEDKSCPNSTWNDPLKCVSYIAKALKANLTKTAITLIDSLPCYDTPSSITVAAMLVTLEEEKLKSVLIKALKSWGTRSGTSVENFLFKQLGKKIVPDLIKLLESRNFSVLNDAYVTLKYLGKDASEAVEVLANKAKTDTTPHLRKLAAEALNAILADMNG